MSGVAEAGEHLPDLGAAHRGFRLAPTSAERRRSAWVERAVWGSALAGFVVVAVTAGVGTASQVVFVLVSAIFVVSLVRVLTISMTAVRSLMDIRGDVPPPAVRSVSVLVACHDEDRVVDDLLSHLRAIDYPAELAEFIVVDDGSSDRTLERLRGWKADWPQLTVLHRPPGSPGKKSGALNLALTRARGEIVVVFDADHRPDRFCLRYLAAAFEEPGIAAVQGRCVVYNPGDGVISELVALDYLGGFVITERGRTSYAGAPSYGGSNCAVRRDVLTALGGWNVDSVTEDTDITMRIYLAGARIGYEPRAVDYEQAVSGLWAYMKQRHRWALGHQQVFRDYAGGVAAARRITPVQRLELLFYLAIYHLPVVCTAGFVLAAISAVVPGGAVENVPALVGLWPLFLWGPLIPVGLALVATRAPLRRFLISPLLLVLIVVGGVIVTTAWARGLFGARYSWAKTGRAGEVPPEPEEAAETTAHVVRPVQRAGGERLLRHPRGRHSRAPGWRPGLRLVAYSVAAIALGVVGYLVCSLWVRQVETRAVSAVLQLTGVVRTEAIGDRLWLYGAHDRLFLLVTDIGCSIGPVVLGVGLVALALRRLVPVRALFAGVVSAVVFMFAMNVVRIATLAWVAGTAGFDAMRIVHDTLASAFAIVSVVATFVVLVAVPARFSRVQLDA